MIVDRAWVKRNIGFDPVATPAPTKTFSFAAAARPTSTPEDFQREIIDFDSEAAEGREFLAFTKATGLSRFQDIPWPRGLAPQTGPKPSGRGALPGADVLIVTWTVDEGHALSRVLTPFYQSDSKILPMSRDLMIGPATKLPFLRSLITTLVTGELLDPVGRIGLEWLASDSEPAGSDQTALV